MADTPPATALPPDGSSLSRKELQSYLKQWGKRANGTTIALREIYGQTRVLLLQGAATTPPSAAPAATNSAAAPTESSKPPAGATQKKKKAETQKRAKRFRSTCSSSVFQRIQRALGQRMYLVSKSEIQRGEGGTASPYCDFVVLGSTGNIYNVHIGTIPSCSCPDHAKGNLCKHILFTVLKVVGLDHGSNLVYQAALLDTELEQMFSTMTNRRVGGRDIMANANVRKTYASLTTGAKEPTDTDGGVQQKSLEEDNACPICFDDMASGNQVTYCRAACGTNFHADCIRRWLGQSSGNPSCPNCRSPWQQSTKGAPNMKEGYTNLGSLQGQSSRRDTSSYSEGYKRSRHC